MLHFPQDITLLEKATLFLPTYIYDKRESITRILSGGRFVEKKGFIYLIRACRLLAEKGVEFECDIFGDGPTKDELVRAVKESGLDWRCYFTGPVDRDRLLDLLGSCEIFVQPSIVAGDGDMEGIPVTLMEAMACGKAVISTNISGIPELINSGTDGILVEQKDELKLAEAMTALIADKELRKRLGEKARAKAAEEFNLSRQVESLIKIFF